MILADTGFLFALAVANDNHHQACTELFNQRRDEFHIPAPVVPETCFMLARKLGPNAEARFLRVLAAERFVVEDLLPADYGRMAELVARYKDLGARGLGAVDASMVAVAERLGVNELATVNPRDFQVVRPNHIDYFVLRP